MWLVLCDAGDVAAHWAYLGLKKRGLSPIEIVLPEELTKGARLTQSISTVGSFVRCELADGRTFDSANLRGVLNRWMQPPVPDPKLDAKDRDYTAQETMAFFVSWLAAVPCRMLNPPTPYCLGGPMLDPCEWMHLAGRAGVPVP